MKGWVSSLVGLVLMVSLVQLLVAQTQQEPADAAEPVPAHRSLRSNQPQETLPAPTDPMTFIGYPDAPPLKVVPRTGALTFYPCAQCHESLPVNPEPRKLEAAPHPAALEHGQGRMWCTDCHELDDRNYLRTINDQLVDFNESHLVCGQCHSNRHKDWYFGSHGKRVANWQGDREIYSCTHCHDPHSPLLKPRKPSSPPPVRAGLSPMPRTERSTSEIWPHSAHQGVGLEPTQTPEVEP
jgi:hypothetical protein